MNVIAAIPVVLLVLSSTALFVFGLNLLFLTWRSTRIGPRRRSELSPGREPSVCVQVPIYNERYVAERVIDAVCRLDWPRARLEVQILDDSDDETVSIASRRAAHWRGRGINAVHVRRATRDGFKAGALAHGLTLTEAPFIAIFDADFVPPADFLRRSLAVFDDPKVGFAQARWGHLDEAYSWFTRLQALAIDFHFLVEQAVRSSAGYFTNFTGTAGVWRRTAIEDSGGWSAATLTEDLDLSYRAQLRGWRAAYLEDLVVPEELPVSIDAYRRQQSRWATGSFQSAFNLLVPVMRSRNRAAVKFQAAIHLLAYGVGPVMLVQLSCYPLLLLWFGPHGLDLPWHLGDTAAVAILVGISPWIGFMVAQTRRGRPWWSGAPAVMCQLVGAGMSLNAMIALFRATRRGGEFVRTPKHRIVERGQEWRDQAYVRVGDPRAAAEAVLGLAALALVAAAVDAGQPLLTAYSAMFAIGFVTVAGLSATDLLEVMALRSFGRRALASVRSAAPAGLLLAACGLLLVVAAQMPEPFEDGYGHWLIAANLASTGHLHDPLFGMEDTWLPGYHVLAAAVLHVFGIGQIGALKVLGALLGLATAISVYLISPNPRQGRLAVVLLVLNPVFLFTSGSAVGEPLMTALLTGGALAAVRGRMKLAALLASLAAITATKAWIWIAAIGAVIVLEQVRVWTRSRTTRAIPAAALALPVVALLVFMQLGFAPVSHSIARGSTEVLSATARGSIPGASWTRLVELSTTYGLAALPLFTFGLLGLVATFRRPSASGPALRFFYLPSIAYLGVVFGLVATGLYTGSHRYLYPALPAFAVAAAGLLDRHPAPVRLAAAAAGALLAVGFLPVFWNFASGNAGLMAAGRAAAGSPSILITDSPVVAYYSGLPPDQIMGSQVLPAEREPAIEWMRVHGVTELVLEDISYYHATSLFPDLAGGRASPPFELLGDQARYQAPGGKPVHAYRFGAGLLIQSIHPGIDASIASSGGQGKTSPLAKGVTLTVAGSGAAGEGMGFGVPIVHYPDGWVYSRTATTVDMSTATSTIWKRTYQLDEIGGDAAHKYEFVPIESRGVIEVMYTVTSDGVGVSVRVIRLAAGYSEVGILNEQSSAFNDFAAEKSQTLLDGRFGRWVPVNGDWARLQSRALSVQWSVPSIAGAQLYGGRESIPPDLDWAGLDYVFGPAFADVTYFIRVMEAR
jgi:glycosyltransferase involved in cell wall biosynthesis